MSETPQEYRKRMLGQLKGQDPLKIQSATSKKLARLLTPVPSGKLRKRPSPARWSIAEIVAHLADAELVIGYRIRITLGTPVTPIQPFDQDDWVVALHYEKRNVCDSLTQFRALREANLRLLKTLTPEQWKQYGVHAERGEESIEMIAQMMAGHDLNHVAQIERIIAPKK
jgi:uncharacterized damage-inducible protein DinB